MSCTSMANARASSWLRPPNPLPFRVTVVSPPAKFGEYAEYVFERRRVSDGWAGGDAVEWIAKDIREDQGDECPLRLLGEVATLDHAQVSSHGVDLLNAGAACEKLFGRFHFVLKGNAVAWERQQRRATAREQEDDEVVRCRV